MKFKNTTSSAIEQIPTEDSIVVTTDTSLVGYCVDNQLHKADKPEWHVIAEQNMGLIHDGVLSSYYANLLESANNNGASTAQAYQGESAYRLSVTSGNDFAWIRWKVDFDNVDYIDINSQRVSGPYNLALRISDSTYDPSSAYWGTWGFDRGIFTTGVRSGEYTVDVSKYTGTHWLYASTTYNPGGYDLFDIELRKADE